jgi:hypothetical protein
MTRRKPMPSADAEESKLGRVFTTFDLTALGVSATLGVGEYLSLLKYLPCYSFFLLITTLRCVCACRSRRET